MEGCVDQAQYTLCENPLVSAQLAQSWNIKSFQYEVTPLQGGTDKIEEYMRTIRNGYGIEGKVLYFLDEQEHVIGLLKKKSVWYIVLRAIREKLKQYHRNLSKNKAGDVFEVINLTEKTVKARLNSRINEIAKWLSLSSETTEAWKKFGFALNEWVAAQLRNAEGKGHNVHDCETMTQTIRLFPVLCATFMKQTGSSDRIEISFK